MQVQRVIQTCGQSFFRWPSSIPGARTIAGSSTSSPDHSPSLGGQSTRCILSGTPSSDKLVRRCRPETKQDRLPRPSSTAIRPPSYRFSLAMTPEGCSICLRPASPSSAASPSPRPGPSNEQREQPGRGVIGLCNKVLTQ